MKEHTTSYEVFLPKFLNLSHINPLDQITALQNLDYIGKLSEQPSFFKKMFKGKKIDGHQ